MSYYDSIFNTIFAKFEMTEIKRVKLFCPKCKKKTSHATFWGGCEIVECIICNPIEKKQKKSKS